MELTGKHSPASGPLDGNSAMPSGLSFCLWQPSCFLCLRPKLPAHPIHLSELESDGQFCAGLPPVQQRHFFLRQSAVPRLQKYNKRLFQNNCVNTFDLVQNFANTFMSIFALFSAADGDFIIVRFEAKWNVSVEDGQGGGIQPEQKEDSRNNSKLGHIGCGNEGAAIL
jgi:hypothetical protein